MEPFCEIYMCVFLMERKKLVIIVNKLYNVIKTPKIHNNECASRYAGFLRKKRRVKFGKI